MKTKAEINKTWIASAHASAKITQDSINQLYQNAQNQYLSSIAYDLLVKQAEITTALNRLLTVAEIELAEMKK